VKRRRVVAAAAAAPLAALVVRPAAATPEAMRAAIAAFTGGAPVAEGRVAIDIAPLVENGNTVPVKVSVASPMTEADHVQAIALFTPRNPEPAVAVFRLGPRAGRAVVATRMRLATSQAVVAVARLSDGSHRQAAVEVEVTLAACVEGS
jgi:sulfur-oxidizing protein SoxY